VPHAFQNQILLLHLMELYLKTRFLCVLGICMVALPTLCFNLFFPKCISFAVLCDVPNLSKVALLLQINILHCDFTLEHYQCILISL